jgi:hypothetical protein
VGADGGQKEQAAPLKANVEREIEFKIKNTQDWKGGEQEDGVYLQWQISPDLKENPCSVTASRNSTGMRVRSSAVAKKYTPAPMATEMTRANTTECCMTRQVLDRRVKKSLEGTKDGAKADCFVAAIDIQRSHAAWDSAAGAAAEALHRMEGGERGWSRCSSASTCTGKVFAIFIFCFAPNIFWGFS